MFNIFQRDRELNNQSKRLIVIQFKIVINSDQLFIMQSIHSLDSLVEEQSMDILRGDIQDSADKPKRGRERPYAGTKGKTARPILEPQPSGEFLGYFPLLSPGEANQDVLASHLRIALKGLYHKEADVTAGLRNFSRRKGNESTDTNAGRQTNCSHQESGFRNQSIYLCSPFSVTSWGSKQLDFHNVIFKPLTKQVNCGFSDMLLGELVGFFVCSSPLSHFHLLFHHE